MGQRAYDASGINLILPLDFIISCDHGREIKHYFREEDLYSVEKKKGVRKDWSNEDLRLGFNGKLGKEVRERWNNYDSPVNLLCYRSVKELERYNEKLKNSPEIYAVPERLKKHFDNKILLNTTLKSLDIPNIPGIVDTLSSHKFSDLCKEISVPFVVQFPYGSSGNSTFIIRDEKIYKDVKKRFPKKIALIRKYISGFSLNVNAIIMSGKNGARVACTHPSVQIIGRPECSNFPSAYCGNDYTAGGKIDKKIVKQVKESITAIGGWMAEGGYRGIFGMDFLVEDGVVYPVEVNPRFQNSTALHTTMDFIAGHGERTLFLYHIAETARKKDAVIKKFLKEIDEKEMMKPRQGSQIIIHNRMERGVVKGELEPGAYRLNGNDIDLVTEGATLADVKDKGNCLITCAVPPKGTVVEANAPLCKVQMFKAVVSEKNNKELTEEAKKIVKAVYRKLHLQKEEAKKLVKIS